MGEATSFIQAGQQDIKSSPALFQSEKGPYIELLKKLEANLQFARDKLIAAKLLLSIFEFESFNLLSKNKLKLLDAIDDMIFELRRNQYQYAALQFNSEDIDYHQALLEQYTQKVERLLIVATRFIQSINVVNQPLEPSVEGELTDDLSFSSADDAHVEQLSHANTSQKDGLNSPKLVDGQVILPVTKNLTAIDEVLLQVVTQHKATTIVNLLTETLLHAKQQKFWEAQVSYGLLGGGRSVAIASENPEIKAGQINVPAGIALMIKVLLSSKGDQEKVAEIKAIAQVRANVSASRGCGLFKVRNNTTSEFYKALNDFDLEQGETTSLRFQLRHAMQGKATLVNKSVPAKGIVLSVS